MSIHPSTHQSTNLSVPISFCLSTYLSIYPASHVLSPVMFRCFYKPIETLGAVPISISLSIYLSIQPSLINPSIQSPYLSAYPPIHPSTQRAMYYLSYKPTNTIPSDPFWNITKHNETQLTTTSARPQHLISWWFESSFGKNLLKLRSTGNNRYFMR